MHKVFNCLGRRLPATADSNRPPHRSRAARVHTVLTLLAPFLGVIGVGFASAWAAPTQTLMVKMSDGTELATDVYLPEGEGPWPTVVARMAYPRVWADGRAQGLGQRGYACVAQDLRGMGGSKGRREAFYTDGWRPGLQDGADTMAWVKEQPWCNGKIATYGESALGISQVSLAPATNLVTCQYIGVAPSNYYHNMAYQGGVWRKNLAEIWISAVGQADTMDLYKAHPCYDEYWVYHNAEAKAGDVTAPAVHVGAWYDIFQQGTINNFVTRQHQGGPGAKGNQKLVMEWGTHTGDRKFDLKLDPNRRELDTGQLRNRFLAFWLKGEQNGIMDEPAVYYYTLGDDTDPEAPGMEWRTANDWPPFPTQETPYYLAPDGLLTREPGTEPASASFTYDPANPFPTCGGANLFMTAGPYDQRVVNRRRKDLLEFASAPLPQPIEVTGHVTARLYVSTDAPDTDFTAKLVDVYPEGDEREILIIDGIRRVKFRNGFEKPAPLLTSAEEIVALSIDLWSTSWVFNTDHRIGLQISSTNYPRFEKNPNTGDDFPDETNLRIAHNTVHMGDGHPSALLLPVRP